MSVLQRDKWREERKAGANSRCPFYRGVCLERLDCSSIKKSTSPGLIGHYFLRTLMSLKTPGSMKTVVRIIHNHSNLLYFSVVPRYTCTVWRIPCFSANSWRVWFTHSLSGCLGAVLSLDPRCCFFSFKAHVCPSDWGLFLCYFIKLSVHTAWTLFTVVQ